jgi:sulfur-oxidizing protein SoxZ
MTINPRIKLPQSVKVGEIIDIKTVVTHVMETGNRKDSEGRPIARDIVSSFTATFAGAQVFSAKFGPGISANPFVSFTMQVPGPGQFEFTWTDDAGLTVREVATLTVEG